MSKICKRIIALLLASCLVAASLPFAWASDEEYVAQHRPTVWEHLIDSTGSSMRKLFNSVVGAFVGSDYCAFTDSGKHEGSEVVSKSLGSDGEYVFFIRCTGCGNTFAYRGSDAQQQYNDSLHSSNLDNGLAVTPEGGLIWYPTVDAINSFEIPPYKNTSLTYVTASFPSLEQYDDCTVSYNITDSSVTVSVSGNHINFNIGYRFGYSVPVDGSYYSLGYTNVFDYYETRYNKQEHSVREINPGHINMNGSSSSNFIFNDSFGCAWNFDPGTYVFEIPAFRVTPTTPISTPSVPTTINIDDRDYTVIDVDFSKRTIHVEEDNRTIIYDDDKITIKEGDTIIDEKNYYIEDEDPDPGPGDSSDPYCNWTPEMWEQLKIMLRQNNSFLEQIYAVLVSIEDKVGENGNDYDFSGMYNLIVEIRDALQDIEANPPPDYSSKLEVVANQLANIWGDVQNIKSRLETIEQNTATTNDKLDTVHDDLADVLAELKEHKGILQQILDTLSKILGHVETIDENVEELKDEESSNNFFNNFIMKFHFLGDIFSIVRQLFADITNDAATVQLVDDGSLPIGDLSSQHFPIDGSPVAIGTAPEVLTRFPDDKYHGVDLSAYSGLDLSWYARYKSRVDALISGFLWFAYIWLLFKRAPGIVRGAAMVDETNIKIDDYRNGG